MATHCPYKEIMEKGNICLEGYLKPWGVEYTLSVKKKVGKTFSHFLLTNFG